MSATEKELRQFYTPGRQSDRAIDARKKLFDELAKFIARRNGWITSIPGAAVVRFECLPLSTLPDELRELGNDVIEEGEGERILPHAIVENVPMEGSTSTFKMRHAGIARTRRFSFVLA